MALGDLKNSLFRGAILRKVRRQLLPEQTRMGPYNAVFAGVVSRRTAEDADTDLLFGGVFRSITDSALRYVKQELAETRG